MSALPLSYPKFADDLRQFNLEIKAQLNPDWNKDYLAIKRQACEHEQLAFIKNPWHLKNASTYVCKTSNWFAAFQQYHAYQSSMEKRLVRLYNVLWALYDLMKSILKVVCWFGLGYYGYPLLFAFTDLYAGPVLLFLLVSFLVNYFIENPILSTINETLWRLCILDVDFLFTVIEQIFFQLVPLYNALIKSFDGVLVLFESLTDLFWSASDTPAFTSPSLEDVCDYSIIRLDGIDEESAQEKSSILKNLRTQVQAELAQSTAHTFGELLNKKYPTFHQGREHQVSFSEVAAKRRAHSGHFSLEQSSGMIGFFGKPTTTEQLLASCEPVAGLR